MGVKYKIKAQQFQRHDREEHLLLMEIRKKTKEQTKDQNSWLKIMSQNLETFCHYT